MLPAKTIHWEDAFRTVIPQINADGLLTPPVRSPEAAAANGIRYPYAGFSGSVASAIRPYRCPQ